MTMKKIPQSVRHIRSLRSLDISCNRLVDIDEAGLELLPDLVELEMHNNRIDHFPALKNLTRLNISNNKFDKLPEAVCQMRNLQRLDISFNTISELPSGLGNLSELQTLILVGNQVSEFPPECGMLVKLTKLDCRRNNITDLAAICKLPELEVLRADYNTVSALDLSFGPRFSRLEVTNNDITRLTLIPGSSHVRTFSLRTLDISHAKLSSLNDFALAALTSLTTLRMNYNSFRSLPDAICSLTDLQVLSCTDNELDSLPVNIGHLQKLETLDMHNNNLTEVPPGIWECGVLRSINMTSNLIKIWHDPPQVLEHEDGTKVVYSRTAWDRKMSASTLAGSWQSSQPPQPPPLTRSLKELYLGDNRLEDDVFHPLNLLKELVVLNLSFNEIQEIPPFWLQSLSQLQRLYLSGNKLTSLPSENLYHMAQLTELFLNGNKLQTLPKELASLKKLAVIDVGSNLLKYNINNHEFDWNWYVLALSNILSHSLIHFLHTTGITVPSCDT
jgi:adenylate cyclase